jgi:hypothetical protein
MASMEPELFELFRGIFGALMRGGLINDAEFTRAHQVLDEHDPMAEQRAAEAARAKHAQDWAEYQRLAEQFSERAAWAGSEPPMAAQGPSAPRPAVVTAEYPFPQVTPPSGGFGPGGTPGE